MTQAQVSYKMSGGSESPILSLPCSLRCRLTLQQRRSILASSGVHSSTMQILLSMHLPKSRYIRCWLPLRCYPPASACLAVTKGLRAASYTLHSSRVIVGVWFVASGSSLELVQCLCFWSCQPFTQNDRLSGFAMATKTCRASELYQRPLNSMRSLSVFKWSSESEYFER